MGVKGDVSTLDTLMFNGQPIIPQVAINGYSYNKRSGIVASNVAGGATRQRKKYYGSVYVADVTFYCETLIIFDYINMFLQRNEGKYFICNLMADRPIVEPYVVQAVDVWKVSDVNSHDITVSTVLEIIPARNKELDELLVPLYSKYYGSDISNIIFSLHELLKEIEKI